MPNRDDDDDDDDRPRSRRRDDDDDDDDDDDRPRRRRRRDDDGPPKKKGSKVLLILLLVAVLPVVLCCGGVGLYMWLGPKSVTVLDATRAKHPEGGTASVTVNLRFGATRPGGQVAGDYVLVAKAGSRTTNSTYTLHGREGGEFRTTFITPELAKEAGPVEFWVERLEGGSSSRVSEVRTIP